MFPIKIVIVLFSLLHVQQQCLNAAIEPLFQNDDQLVKLQEKAWNCCGQREWTI